MKDETRFELLFVIVNCGQGSKAAHHAKKNGATGTTIMMAFGTVKNPVLRFLELCDTRKEIVIIAVESVLKKKIMLSLDQKFHFNKEYHGIAFSVSIAGLFGAHTCSRCSQEIRTDSEVEGEVKMMHHAIMGIVEKGSAEQVIESAIKAGAGGGTIINARGSGIHETARLFAMDIEPEKEIVLIVTDSEKTKEIVQSIRSDLEMDEPGKGILIVLDVNDVIGLHQ
jgi:nitrogen regulatory protein PII